MQLKQKYLTEGGRLVLNWSTLASLPVYLSIILKLNMSGGEGTELGLKVGVLVICSFK